jgi:hypothetical protein
LLLPALLRSPHIAVELFFAGDILLYAISLGKEGSDGWWCTYCKLMKDEWQEAEHEKGTPWMIEDITSHAETIKAINNGATTQFRKGVKIEPIFKSIPLSHYIISILHICIGC